MIAWAVETVVAVSALLLLVIVVRGPVGHWFGAGWAYALWWLPWLRIATPPLAWFGADLSWSPIVIQATAIGEAGARTTPAMDAQSWPLLLLAAWAGGALCLLAWQCLSYRLFLRAVAARSRPAYPAAHEGVPMIESAAVNGPIAIGLLTPRIIVPFDFASRYGAAEQRLALAHERIHHARGDLWWNGLALLLLALLWWNPLAWLAFRAFRADQELACDAAVARGLSGAERHLYAAALVKSASPSHPMAVCPFNRAATLKRRLKMMTLHRDSVSRRLGGLAAVGGLFAAGIALSAPSHAQSDGAAGKERRIIVREFGGDGKLKLSERDVAIGERELSAKLESCPEAQRMMSDVRTGEGEQKNRVRLVVCGKDGETSPETRQKLLAALERARTQLGSDAELKPENRAQVLEALQREIARIRGEGN